MTLDPFATDLLLRTLLIAAITLAGWFLLVLNGIVTIERLFADVAIGLGLGFIINMLIAIFSPESFS